MCSPRLRIMAVAMMLLASSPLVAAQDNEVNAQASFVRKISEKRCFYMLPKHIYRACASFRAAAARTLPRPV